MGSKHIYTQRLHMHGPGRHQVTALGRYLFCQRCGAHALIEAPSWRDLLKTCSGHMTKDQKWFLDCVSAGREPR